MTNFELFKFWHIHARNKGDLSTYKLFKRFYDSDGAYQTRVREFIASNRLDPLRQRLFHLASSHS